VKFCKVFAIAKNSASTAIKAFSESENCEDAMDFWQIPWSYRSPIPKVYGSLLQFVNKTQIADRV
jgi:hypothetical protein